MIFIIVFVCLIEKTNSVIGGFLIIAGLYVVTLACRRESQELGTSAVPASREAEPLLPQNNTNQKGHLPTPRSRGVEHEA